MSVHPLAGQPAPANLLVDVSRLEKSYYDGKPDVTNPAERVSFGTSGHRGTSLNNTFTESHILAITQAICEYRANHGITGPLFMGKDTHALSGVAQQTALEVLAANRVETVIQDGGGFTPTPVVSHAILCWNRNASAARADGIVITPSHNPPEDGGFKYNPPDGGPADTDVTTWIQNRANELLHNLQEEVKRIAFKAAAAAPTTHKRDFVEAYTNDLAAVIDMEAIRGSRVRIGVDPLGGASVAYWPAIAERYQLDLTVVNQRVDPQFAFMTVDHDGRIRMDCSSPYAMASLVKRTSDFDIAWGNDPDADRHGIATRSAGLMNPNHYLAVAIQYLLANRPAWLATSVVGKTVVSSSIIDRVVKSAHRDLWEVPVGFKWFAPRLFDASCCFGGEESAGASFLRRDASVWTTDKDGIILGLLAAEILARTGKDPGEHYRDLTARFGQCFYTRIDAPATLEQKEAFKKLSADDVTAPALAGDPVTARITAAPGNQASIGGLKVSTEGGWFAARPSGTENIYKLYAESFHSKSHLNSIVVEAQRLISDSLSRR